MTAHPAPARVHPSLARVPAPAWTALLVLVAAVVYGIAASGRAGPFIDNDEFIYGNTARNLAAGDGFTWRGVVTPVRSLYEVAIAPAWLVSQGHGAYTLAKLINVVCICCTAIPTWLMARELLRSRWALLPTAVVLLGAWMEMSGKLMTESLALPAAACVSYATLMLLRRGSVGWLAAVVGLCVLAMLARSQLVALLALPGMAMSLDLLRRPRDLWSSTLRERRNAMAISWALLVIGLLVAAGPGRSVLGGYASFLDRNPGLLDFASWTGQYLLNLALLLGVAPFVAVLALILTRAAWRDATSGPLLSLAIPLVLLVALEGGWLSGTEGRVLERYLIYAAPVLLVGAMLAFGRTRPVPAVAAGVATVLGMLLINPPSVGTEGSTLQTLVRRFLDYPQDLSGTATMAALVTLVITVPTVGMLVLAQDRRRIGSGASGPELRWVLTGVTVALTVLSLLSANQSLWQSGNDAADSISAGVGGSGTWTTDRAGPPSYAVVPAGVPALAVLWTEFFNGPVRNVLVPAGVTPPGGSYGPTCGFDLAPNGSFAGSQGCRPLGASFVYFFNRPTHVTLQKQVGTERVGFRGLAVQVEGSPEILAWREDLCSALVGACGSGLLDVWSPGAGRVVLRFAGGDSPQSVTVAGKPHVLPVGVERNIIVPVQAGYTKITMQPSWNALAPGIPVLKSAELVRDRTARDI